MCARTSVSPGGRQISGHRPATGVQGARGGGTKWRSQTPRETGLVSQPPLALLRAQDSLLFGGSLGFVHRKPCDDWLPHWRFHVGVEVARRGGQRAAGPGPCGSRDTLCSQKRPVARSPTSTLGKEP